MIFNTKTFLNLKNNNRFMYIEKKDRRTNRRKEYQISISDKLNIVIHKTDRAI